MRLHLHPVEPLSPANRQIIVSLPLPDSACTPRIAGARRQECIPLGHWPESRLPRRALIRADLDAPLAGPLTAELLPGAMPSGAADGPGPLVQIVNDREIYHHRDAELYHYVRSDESARIRLGQREYELFLGWQMPSGERRFAQWMTAIPHWQGELTAAFTVGGHVYAGHEERNLTMAEAGQVEQLDFVRERTVSLKAFIVAGRDGSLEIACHAANVEAYGSGDLCFGLPLLMLRTAGEHPVIEPEIGATRAAWNGDTWSWLPFQDLRIFQRRGVGGLTNRASELEDIFVNGSDQGLVKGAGLSFALRLTPDGAPPRTRCLAEPAWYLQTGLFGLPLPDRNLATFPILNSLADLAADVFKRNAQPGEGPCRGGVFRYLDAYPDGRYEFSNDGNEAGFLWRAAYLRGDGELLRLARAAGRYIADIAVDHNHFDVHYHADTPQWNVFSLIYLRFGGMIFNYLESGDPYYLDLTRAVADRWINLNRQNQPRRNLGRDTEPVEGILWLYDLTGDRHYLDAAADIARDVSRSLDPQFFWRSGFGVGPYWGVNALRGTAWNGSHLFAGLAEFLVRAQPAEWPDYDRLMTAARGMARRIIRSIDEDYQGFHRTSGAFLRRMALLADKAGDRELAGEIARVIAAIERNYREETGDRFFHTGHHCAGYLENPVILNALDLFVR